MKLRLHFSRSFSEFMSIFGSNFLLKSISLSLLPVILFLSCNTDDLSDTEVPSMILNGFYLKFPKAEAVEWEKETAGYEVDFESSGKDHKVLLDAEGNILKFKKEISYSELPLAVQNRIKESFSSANDDMAVLLETGSMRYYQVELERFVINDRITFNETGEVISGISF